MKIAYNKDLIVQENPYDPWGNLAPNGDILEWDYQHDEVERYDKISKKHKGAFNPKTREQIKDPKPGRWTPKFTPNQISPQTIETVSSAAQAAVTIYVIIKGIEVGIVIGTRGSAASILAL